MFSDVLANAPAPASRTTGHGRRVATRHKPHILARMCGRYSNTTPPEAMRRIFQCVGSINFPPTYNCAPTQRLPVVALGKDGRRLVLMTWGLVPHWSRAGKPGYATINARAETVASKPTFRDAFQRRRCLVPADGFFEWQPTPEPGGKKLPWRITMADGQPFAMAGIWERWQPGDDQAGEKIDSFSIIVTDANDLLRPIHERMPVILAPDDWDRWLERESPGPTSLLRPFPSDRMRAYRVGTQVNDPRNNDPGCLEPVD